MRKVNNSGYSVILAILMVGFMLILTSGVFLLVLGENKDTKIMEHYLKAFAGAEGAVEMALLQAKKHNFSYSEKYEKTDDISKILGDVSDFNDKKEPYIYYDLDSVTDKVEDKELKSGNFDIIPLFYYDFNGDYKKLTDLEVSGLNSNIVWNIVGENGGISGVGNFSNSTEGNYKIFDSVNLSYSKKTVFNFIDSSDENYLILHNTSSAPIEYSITATNPGEFFTKEYTLIIGSGEIAGYKQNLRVKVNNSEYLNLLKYSIFSN